MKSHLSLKHSCTQSWMSCSLSSMSTSSLCICSSSGTVISLWHHWWHVLCCWVPQSPFILVTIASLQLPRPVTDLNICVWPSSMCVWLSCFYIVDNCILSSYSLFCNFLSNGHLASVVQVPVCVETCVMGWLQITTYVTDATVLRDGMWVRLDSRNLVPGDIVKVRSDWLLPCDLLLIQGNQCGHPSQRARRFPRHDCSYFAMDSYYEKTVQSS